MIEVLLAKSLICFLGQCHPALVGERTPVGVYPMQYVELRAGGKAQHVLMFAPDKPGYVFAIHKAPSARRRALLEARSTVKVTHGCINVSDAVFDALASCCSNQSVTISP